jgi:SPP1 gp7 family putative phage head morphogenesis protein
MQATINEQVSLIKSIPSQYFTQIEGVVMRSVQTGRDLGQLTKDLQEQFGVTRRRAATIARSQNNIATSSMTRARQDALGITEGTWVHSGAGKHPRPTHVAMSGKRFNLKKGMYDSAVKRWILPAQEPGCRCIWRPVIAGFS